MKYTNKFLTSALASLTAAVAAADRPNIVLFMVDDMGWQDTSLPFWDNTTPLNKRYHTPNMERLADKGAMFTAAYACSISSPSRCSLLTGMNAARHRVTNWTLNYNTGTDGSDPAITLPQWNVNGIQPVDGIERSTYATSFVKLLKENGYHTIHCGKAHFGSIGTPSADPSTMGFDVNISGHAAGALASYLGEQRYGHDNAGNATGAFSIPGLEAYWDKDVFATEALTIEAIKALEQAETLSTAGDETPFFLYMAHYAVHIPIQPDKRFIDKYLAAGLSDTEAAYATLVEGMDKSLGDIMDYLERSGKADNTIVIFMSDNGGLANSDRTPPLGVQNAPLRSGKGSAYEGGIREPMIVYWPGITAAGSKISDYVMIEDFFPSILEMAGIGNYSTVQTVDGISFVPMLKGAATDAVNRSLYWNFPNLWNSGENRKLGIGATATVRNGDYKLIYWYKDGKKELYNIREDIGETTDLASQQPELVATLSKDLADFLRGCDAQRPTLTATGEPCPWPDENR